jgi:hypothetical protein
VPVAAEKLCSGKKLYETALYHLISLASLKGRDCGASILEVRLEMFAHANQRLSPLHKLSWQPNESSGNESRKTFTKHGEYMIITKSSRDSFSEYSQIAV